MKGILPESIRTRTRKTYFSQVFASEVQRNWDVYEAAFGPSARPVSAERGYLDQQRFWGRLLDLRGGMEATDTYYVCKMVALEGWLRGLTLPRPQLVTVGTRWRRSGTESQGPRDGGVQPGARADVEQAAWPIAQRL
jgi:hypothetical protein